MKRALDFLREHNEVALATVGGGGTLLPESGEKKQVVIDKLKEYLNKFADTSDGDISFSDSSMPEQNKNIVKLYPQNEEEDLPMAAEDGEEI